LIKVIQQPVFFFALSVVFFFGEKFLPFQPMIQDRTVTEKVVGLVQRTDVLFIDLITDEKKLADETGFLIEIKRAAQPEIGNILHPRFQEKYFFDFGYDRSLAAARDSRKGDFKHGWILGKIALKVKFTF
jgi:hypothetical protein